MQGQKGLKQAGDKEITESYIQHSTYRSDRHMQVGDSLGIAPRHWAGVRKWSWQQLKTKGVSGVWELWEVGLRHTTRGRKRQ